MKRTYLIIIINASLWASTFAQSSSSLVKSLPEKHVVTTDVLKGVVMDMRSKAPLPYANIYVLHHNLGVVSNEKGDYSIDLSQLDDNDTLRFQYVGYQSKDIVVKQLKNTLDIYLDEAIINLNESVIFGSELNAEDIVKQVLKNKQHNYKRSFCRKKTFIREQYTVDIDNIQLDLKKSSIDNLNGDIIQLVENKIPKNSISYTDFLGDIYFSDTDNGKHIELKIDPLKVVSLKEKDLAEFDQLETIFTDAISGTKEGEYWKIKSGVFSQKIAIEADSVNEPGDSLAENERRLSYYRNNIGRKLAYVLLDDKDAWEFLYKTSRFLYTLVGGATVNGEDVYIIEFSPKENGEYKGRLYVSVNSYALVRADYQYAQGKKGTDVNLLGIGYTQNKFCGSVYFEKQGDYYTLKYFSKKVGIDVRFNRNLALVKKKQRFLVDKKMREVKVGVDMQMNSVSSIELLVLDQEKISPTRYHDFKQQQKMEIILVDEFNDDLWKGYSILAPTKQMREYRKHE